MRRNAGGIAAAGRSDDSSSGSGAGVDKRRNSIAYSTSPGELSYIAEDKEGFGALNLTRASSKEIGDRVSIRYPVPPPVVNNKTLVDNMVR